MPDRLKSFSFRTLSGNFKLEQFFGSITYELLINFRTTGYGPNEFIHGPWNMALYLEEFKMWFKKLSWIGDII